MQNSSNAPAEPLAVSAPLALELATVSCTIGAANLSCEPYHGFWQYMRLMGLGKTLSGQSARYLFTLEQFAREWARRREARPPKILISGSADYSMLAHVLQACRRLKQPAAVTVLDVCSTPLLLNQWYARRAGLPITVVRSDVLQHHPVDAYDLIITSGFLGYFSPATRPRMFQGYAAMLHSGGRLVFANRIRPGNEGETVGFSPQQIDKFAARAAQLSSTLPAAASLSPEDASRMARSYAQFFRSYPVNGEDSVKALARFSGLRWRDGGVLPSATLQPQVSGPTIGDGADYLFVILEK
jgi:hypothetical protein